MVKNFIGFAEMKQFIDDVITLCVWDGRYQPFMKEFAVDYCILKYYTDYDINKGFEEIYSDIYNSKYVDEMLTTATMNPQVSRIMLAIDEAIRIQTRTETNKGKLGEFVDSLFDSLDNPETVDRFLEMIREGEEDGEQI